MSVCASVSTLPGRPGLGEGPEGLKSSFSAGVLEEQYASGASWVITKCAEGSPPGSALPPEMTAGTGTATSLGEG